MEKDIQNVLVIGGNGTTGQLICDILMDSSHYRPIAMIRDKSQKEKFDSQNIPTVIADLEGDLRHAFQNVDRVIFAAGSGGGTSKEKTIAVDQEGAKRCIDFAKEFGVQKFVMLSSMGSENPSKDSEIYEYLLAKHHADVYLKESGLTYTIVRPGGLTDGAATQKIQATKSLEQRGKISRADVAHTLVYVLPSDIADNTYFEILSGEKQLREAVKELEEA